MDLGHLLGLSASIIFTGVGIACAALYKSSPAPCGSNGMPPLPLWVLGTGISYLILGAIFIAIEAFECCRRGGAHPLFQVIAMCLGFFSVPWTIVGIVSLTACGDCQAANIPIWIMAISAVFFSAALIVEVAVILGIQNYERLRA